MATECLDEAGLARFVENRMVADARAATEQHVSSCDHCRGLIGKILATGSPGFGLPPPEVAGAMIDRYVTVSELGFGAMGRVYLAVDPELDRRVAIKLLRRVDPDGDRDLRLRREAQALARITHPNVATIFDVGEAAGNLFLAMEYVGGGTLSDWLRAKRRPWQDVVRVFAGAGRGLAAVHARGLVHRDFKPDNVLLDEHGEAKVTDFGLVATFSEHAGSVELGGADAMDVFGSLTRTGAVVGTPAYMSPEQFEAGVVDARSDQFSFFVALYEALYATRPFPGSTVAELKAALRGPPVEPTAEQRRGAPGWLHQVVARGLATEPAARFPSMAEAVDALGSDVRRKRNRIIVGAIAGVAALGVGAVLVIARSGGAEPCTAAPAEIGAVWNPDKHAALRGAFEQSRAPFAADAATGVIATLDRYAGQWSASHTQVCKATRVSETQSVATMDLRMSCLARRKRELAGFVDALATATPAMVEHAVDAAGALPSIAECDHVAGLAGMAPIPTDPAVRAEIEAVRDRLIRADVWIESGMLDLARPLIETQVAAAARLRYAPLEAVTLLARGRAEDAAGEFTRSIASYQGAAAAADRGRDDRTRFRAWAFLVGATTAAGKLEDAEAQLPAANAALERGGSDPELAQLWDTTRARIHYLRGRIAEAETLYLAAIERARARGDQRSVGELLHSLVLATADVADPAKTLPLAEESVELARREYGARHPETARRDASAARLLTLQGKLDDGIARAEGARATLVEVYGTEHIDVASIELTLGGVLRRADRADDARKYLVHCLAVMRAKLGAHHFKVADALMSLALLERRAKQLDVALGYAQEARSILEAGLGPDTDGLVAAFHTIAMIQRDQGKDAEAQVSLEAGLALGERTAPDNPRLGLFLAELGSIRLGVEDWRGAEQWLERAIAAYGTGSEPDFLAYMKLDLANAKGRLGKWKDALALATEARAALTDPPDIAEADAAIAKARRHVK